MSGVRIVVGGVDIFLELGQDQRVTYSVCGVTFSVDGDWLFVTIVAALELRSFSVR